MIKTYGAENIITGEILDLVKADHSFMPPLLKPLEKLIKENKWLVQRYSKALYIFQPIEIVKRTDNYHIKCFVLEGIESVNPSIWHMDIGSLYTASEITDNKLLKELNGELAKAMLTDNLKERFSSRY